MKDWSLADKQMDWLAALFSAVWIISMACCARGLIKTIRYWEQRDRYMRWWQGRCLECGYDVRATIEQCPECGTRLPLPPKERALPESAEEPAA